MKKGFFNDKFKNSMILILLFLFLTPWNICGETTKGEAIGKENIRILIDPGHGEVGSGAEASFQGITIHEEELNLKIAEYLKEELQKYKGVTVYMTRDGAYNVDLDARTEIGVEKGADLLVSLHNNAYGPNADYDHGSTVLVARGQYKKELAEKEQQLGTSILYELSCLGLENQGLLVRDSFEKETYENGSIADYYRIIRNGILCDIPSIIIEHAFLDCESDYENYLSSDEKLKKLARADARGIARCYALEKNDGTENIEDISNVVQKFLYIKDENITHNEVYERIFFANESEIQGNNTEEKSAKKVFDNKERLSLLYDRDISMFWEVIWDEKSIKNSPFYLSVLLNGGMRTSIDEEF